MKPVQFIIQAFIYTALGLLMVCLLPGCSKDWLDAKPDKTSVVPASLADFQGLLDYSERMNVIFPGSGEIASDNYYTTDEIFGTLPIGYDADAYIWKKRGRQAGIQDWDASYQRILIDNIILDGLTKITPTTAASQEEWNNVKGQALFNRAFTFFSLLQTYAPPYDESTSQNDLGIPLRSTIDINAPTIRNTVKEGYELVIKEASDAAGLLPEKSRILTRASKAAAYALLSRIYLSMGDYEKSLTSSNACLNLHSTLLDYNYIPDNMPFIGRYNSEVIYHAAYLPGFMTYVGMIIPELYNSYAADDLRKTRFFQSNPDGSVGFKGNYDNVTYTFFYGLATDEVYLNKAECQARLGKTIEPMQTLNALLKARWNNLVIYPEHSAASPEEALMLILTERRKELVFRGLRWMDLRRLNKESEFAVTLTRTVQGQTYSLEPESQRYTFPIPDDIVEQTQIKQNPGWEN